MVGSAAVAALAGGGLGVTRVIAAGRPARSTLTRSTFTPLVGSTFGVATPQGGPTPLKLVRVDDLPGAQPGAERRFSLIFSNGGAPFRQDTYGFAHPAIGDFSLFVAPVDRPERGRYQAIIN